MISFSYQGNLYIFVLFPGLMANDSLLVFKCDEFDFYYSPDFADECIAKGTELMVGIDIYDQFISQQSYDKLIELYLNKINNHKIAILAADGVNILDVWHYSVGENYKSMQSWISANENYGLQILDVCNPLKAKLESKKSALVYPDGIYSIKKHIWGDVKTELFIPGTGHIDEYLIEYHERILEDSLNN